ncbi:MAG TPA: HAD-IIIC family phosphatase [Solirubrobacteraceae bacterium]|nr:HAD-IIIC family phosphatase [Solirubrobacteraceae bacterium]
MRLSQALEIVQRGATETGEPFTVWLACGCEPLHLRTFLAAELMGRLAATPVEVHTGFFDDLAGNIERASDAGDDPVAVIVEWPDLDPRLGLRRLGGWRPDQLDDIVKQTRTALERLERSILTAAGGRRVVCVMPTLTLPPLFPQPPRQSGPHELALRAMAAGTAARLSSEPGVSLVSHQRLDSLSPPAARRDVKAELAAGFPYSLDHASALAALLAELLCPPVPRKGLITDLDETLWAGVLDEAGPQDVSWTGDDHRHALYQQFLASLAGAGVLIGVATRNDPSLVAAALARADLLIAPDALYPVEVTWGAKSHAVRRILETWNIAADAVVFIDDSPLERDEVRQHLPRLLPLALPADDDDMPPFLEHLRALFGKDELSAEDGLRLESIRAARALHSALAADDGSADFLAGVDGAIEFCHGTAQASRALELIGKATQFNLNGQRVTEADLAKAAQRGGELVTVSYTDRFGPLGVIAALLVTPGDGGPAIDAWAMSCRAFARRVEHHTLRHVFDRFAADEVAFGFHPTTRNVAVREFLTSLDGCQSRGRLRVTRANFERSAPPLVHRVLDGET